MRDSPAVTAQLASVHPPIDSVIAAVAGREECAVLDSAAAGPARGRFTIVAADPIRTLSIPSNTLPETELDPFESLRRALQTSAGFDPGRATFDQPLSLSACTPEQVFPGGWIGYFAYEAGRFVERLPSSSLSDIRLPIARFSLYDTAAIHDALTGRWTLVAVELPGPGNRPAVKLRLGQWNETLQEAARSDGTVHPAPPGPEPVHSLSRSEYESRVSRALAYIAAGDIYQVNLARRETYVVREPAVATYLRLRRSNPAAYASFLRWVEPAGGESAVLSSSPELFLRLSGRHVVTRPIKGTRPRSGDSVLDRLWQQELCASEKDRAELAMIVDLERNDLGRVCEFGSIRVDCPPDSPAFPYTLETHPTVHHLVAEVTGTLAADRDAIDLVRACFPGGSITGAPKVRAMEIIDELEPVERSVYTGSIGYFSLSGHVALNIAIRTLIVADGRCHLYTGGGIVADSRPADEYRETRAKALGMRRALGCADAAEPVFAQENA